MRVIGVVTIGRTDWSLWRPILDLIKNDPHFSLRLYATSMHLSPEFGSTFKDILADGFQIDEKVELLMSSDSPNGIAMAMGLGNIGFGQVFSRKAPDILMVMGDRFETLSAVTAAMPFKIPVVHLYGGEATEGAIDELIRHAITKLSHIHFTSTENYADRIKYGLGEQSWRVHNVGATSIDEIKRTKILSREEFCYQYGLPINEEFLLVTYHPVTLEFEETEVQMKNLLVALETTGKNILFTYPNADTSGRVILDMIREYQSRHPSTRISPSLGRVGYYSALAHAAAMVGNSSSGIVEAPSFKLPVVNIGTRQKGRIRSANVIDVQYSLASIQEGLKKAMDPVFQHSIQTIKNPYGDGLSSEKIVNILRKLELNQDLITKVLTANQQRETFDGKLCQVVT